MVVNVDTSKTAVIEELLGEEAQSLPAHECGAIDKAMLHLPGGDAVDRIYSRTERSNQVLCSLQRIFGRGRLADAGCISVLPIDRRLEHSAGASFAPNPMYFDPESIVKPAGPHGSHQLRRTFRQERPG